MAVVSDPGASQSKAISTTTDETGTASYVFTITTAGTYYLWGRVLAPTTALDSFYVAMDTGAEDVYDAAEGTWSTGWQWTRLNGRNGTSTPLTLNPRSFSLSAGTHTLKIRGRERGTELDRVFMTNDAAAIPAP